MNAQTQTRTVLETTLHTVAGQLVERAAKVSTEGRGSQVLRWLLAIGAIFLAWKALRGLKSIFWTLFGLGMAVFWTGLWRVWF
ncbi:hypothetical protein [Lysobacter brunescens]|uniref:Transmembrane protein n=1 Tax=Lysobacter brunescens TaxID=262323 RepID=A0ABW2YCJ4_9GAMM